MSEDFLEDYVAVSPLEGNLYAIDRAQMRVYIPVELGDGQRYR